MRAATASLAQKKKSLGGKILRVTAKGNAPASGNPFKGSPLVYSYGHRNVQGLAWDSAGRLWATEFGDHAWDELNLIRAGHNYGWPATEGKTSNPAYTSPKAQWHNYNAGPSGIAIINNVAWIGGLTGHRLLRVKLDGASVASKKKFLVNAYGRLRTAQAAPDGTLWLTTSNTDGRATPRGATTGSCDCGSAEGLTSTDPPVVSFADQAAWRAWLAAHHADAPEGVWLKIARKSKGAAVESVDYPEALEVALCFGWIDGQKKGLDETHWLQRFTPRRSRSIWSKVNRAKAEALVSRPARCNRPVSPRSSAPRRTVGGTRPMTVRERRRCPTTSLQHWRPTPWRETSSRRWTARTALRSCIACRRPRSRRRGLAVSRSSWRC